MGFDSPDLYNQPEHFGLTVIGQAQDNMATWMCGFDMFIVLKAADGTLYWAQDSGCSCPAPFEDYTSLSEAKTGTRMECHAALSSWSWDADNGEVRPGKLTSAVDLHFKLSSQGRG